MACDQVVHFPVKRAHRELSDVRGDSAIDVLCYTVKDEHAELSLNRPGGVRHKRAGNVVQDPISHGSDPSRGW